MSLQDTHPLGMRRHYKQAIKVGSILDKNRSQSLRNQGTIRRPVAIHPLMVPRKRLISVMLKPMKGLAGILNPWGKKILFLLVPEAAALLSGCTFSVIGAV